MNALIHITNLFLLICIWSVAGQINRDCKCQPRRPVDVVLQQLEGPWYVVAMVNETNLSEQRNCNRMDYRYNYGQGTVTVTRTSIPYNETDIVTNEAVFGMITPGIFDVTYLLDNGTVEQNFHDHYMQYTPDVSFIVSTCERFNQQIFTDRVALTTRNRFVDFATIQSIFNSIGINLDDVSNNQLYIVNQTNCSN